MKIGFHGAARTVTGSKVVVTLEDGKKILTDCGLFQGMGPHTDDLNGHFGFNPKSISALLITHAHIDHTGLIPKLIKEGFTGKIYATEATMQLTEILLHDSAEIQTYEIEHINQRRAARNLPPTEPLYTHEDVEETMKYFEVVEYNKEVRIFHNTTAIFINTGHLPGSAAIYLTVTENGKHTSVHVSGDVGRYNSVLLKSPEEFPQADYLVLESTYGDKRHGLSFATVKTIRQWVESTCLEKKGKLIIPAFSVGRTQEVLYALNQLDIEKRLPDIKYFVDSPLSRKATDVLRNFTDLFNDRLQTVMAVDNDPFDFDRLKYVESVEDSKRLVDYEEPCVIISASGTADAGRVRHHIRQCINDERNSILFVGYCSEASLGGELLNGAKQVELFGEDWDVKAEVGKMEGLSAHADYDELSKYIACQNPQKMKSIFLVHGEYSRQKNFAARLETKEFRNVIIPDMHEQYQLS